MIQYCRSAPVQCPLYHKPETVYVYLFDPDDPSLAKFNGCEASFHKCPECDEICKKMAIDYLMSHPYPETGPQLHMP